MGRAKSEGRGGTCTQFVLECRMGYILKINPNDSNNLEKQ
jgi:hypothetical protein